MTSGGGTRTPTWKERENNMRRERRRRAIAAKIFAGLRMYGNYKLPKHCDNNHVLMALCHEAGWIVEPDGTTYRKGCKPVEYGDMVGGSATVSPLSSYHQTPGASYNPSPSSSAFASPTSSSYAATPIADGSPQLQWLKNLSAASSSPSFPKLSHLYIPGGSISAPVTPPLSSPTARSPRARANCHDQSATVGLAEKSPFYLPSSTPSSPGRQIFPDPKWFAGLQIPQGVPTSPTFSLVKSNPFSFQEKILADSGPHVWTSGQNGASSPRIVAENTGYIPNTGVVTDEFAFGKNGKVLVKPWEGEKIHEEPGIDDLELTLGSTRTRWHE